MNYMSKTPKQLIDEIRQASGMTDSEIADATGIMSQSTVSRLRGGALTDTSSENWRALVSLHKHKIMQLA